MAKIEKNNLGYLGMDFQIRILLQVLTDNQFATSIIELIDPNYFEDSSLRIICGLIKDAYNKYEIIPDMGSLESRLLENVQDDITRKFAITQLRKIQEGNLNDTLWVQETAMKFCKQQELKKSVEKINKIIERGNIDDYEECEKIIRKALDYGQTKDYGISVKDNVDAVLADDFRKPIPTGINGLDDAMNGGLSRGELGIILAPFGVGKTTMITKLASSAAADGQKVLQIFFEDTEKIIQRKHFACWTGYKLNDLGHMRNEVKEVLETKTQGEIRLKRFPSFGTTIPMIKQYIRKCIAQGFKPDIIFLDYIDVVTPSSKIDDVNVGEGMVMREFESMLSELDMAGWTAVQGNRSSIKATVVESDQMGGSIKKGQIGHFVVSIAKSLDQQENGTATMAILKSRFGVSGVIFENIIFDNATITIDMGTNQGSTSHSEHKRNVEAGKQQRVNLVLEAAQRRNTIMNTLNTEVQITN